MTSLLRWFLPSTTKDDTAPPNHQTNETQQQQQHKQADPYPSPPKTVENEGDQDDDDDGFYGADDLSRPWYKKVEYNILVWTTVVVLIGIIVGVSVGVSNSNQSYEPRYFPPPPPPPSPPTPPPPPPPPGPDLLPPPAPAPAPAPSPDYEDDLQFSMFSSEENKKNSDNFTKSTATCVGGSFITRWDLYYEEPPKKTTQGMETPISGLKIECSDGSTFEVLTPLYTTTQIRTAQNQEGFDQIEGRYGDYIDWIFVQSSAADGPKFSFTYTCVEPGEKVSAVEVMYKIEKWGDDNDRDNEKALVREIGFLCTGNNNNNNSTGGGGGEIVTAQVQTEDACSPWVGQPVQGRYAVLYRAKPLVCPCGEVATGLQSWAYTDKTAITSIRVQCSDGSSVPPSPEQLQPPTREVSWGQGGTSVVPNIVWGPSFVRSIGGEVSPLEGEGYGGVEMIDTVTCGGGTGGRVLGVVVLSRATNVEPIPRLQVVCGSAENCFEYQTQIDDGCLAGF